MAPTIEHKGSNVLELQSYTTFGADPPRPASIDDIRTSNTPRNVCTCGRKSNVPCGALCVLDANGCSSLDGKAEASHQPKVVIPHSLSFARIAAVSISMVAPRLHPEQCSYRGAKYLACKKNKHARGIPGRFNQEYMPSVAEQVPVNPVFYVHGLNHMLFAAKRNGLTLLGPSMSSTMWLPLPGGGGGLVSMIHFGETRGLDQSEFDCCSATRVLLASTNSNWVNVRNLVTNSTCRKWASKNG